VSRSLTHKLACVTAKRTAHERLPEVLAAAVRVFARDGYRSAHMSDVAREAGLSEAAIYRYVDSKEVLFALAIRHALLLEPLPPTGEAHEAHEAHEAPAAGEPATEFPLKAPSLDEMIHQAREFVAAEVPFGSLADALLVTDPQALDDPAGELESITRELFGLEELTAQAADMIERSARELPELADLLNTGLRRPVLDALTRYLDSRTKAGKLRATPDTAATARLVLETLTWFARHRHSDPYGAAIPASLAQDTAVDALLHALVPPLYLTTSLYPITPDYLTTPTDPATPNDPTTQPLQERF
jgi:AcrR family transcriptional regulator